MVEILPCPFLLIIHSEWIWDVISRRHQVGVDLRCVGERVKANSRPNGGEKSRVIIGSRNGIQWVEAYKPKIKYNVEVQG